MMTALTDLENELRGPLAASGVLVEQESADLLRMVRSTRQQERADLNAAIDQVIGALPWPLRAPAKRIMFGDLLD